MALITLSGGLQDAYTYLTRSHVFANAQTGNIVLLASSLFSGEWRRALSYIIPVLSFACGILVSALLQHRFRKHDGVLHWRHIIIALEIVLLTAVAFIPSSFSAAANAVVSFSCAMQVEAFRKARGYAYASTMCIGNLRSCMESIAHYVTKEEEEGLMHAAYYALIILLFAIGAGAGAVLASAFGLYAILASSILLAAAFLLMIRGKK